MEDKNRMYEDVWDKHAREEAENKSRECLAVKDKSETYEAWLAEGKIEINNLVWRFLPGNTSLDDADMIAVKIYEMIDGWWEFKKNE